MRARLLCSSRVRYIFTGRLLKLMHYYQLQILRRLQTGVQFQSVVQVVLLSYFGLFKTRLPAFSRRGMEFAECGRIVERMCPRRECQVRFEKLLVLSCIRHLFVHPFAFKLPAEMRSSFLDIELSQVITILLVS